jgi:hypothetical protein
VIAFIATNDVKSNKTLISSLRKRLRITPRRWCGVAKTYNKKVKSKSFHVGDLVWKIILPIESKSNKFGKWSPS